MDNMQGRIFDFGVNDSSDFGFTLKDSTGSRDIRFTLPERFVPSSDLIALSLCTLIGQKYSEIELDLAITDRTRRYISAITNSEIKSGRAALPDSAPPGRTTALNFSGGFDSLAALALMPENRKLVSLDFGGSFERESKFFNSFDTTVVRTNFRNLGFASNHWTFMGIGTILLRDYLEIETYSFGSILEASPWNFKQSHFTNKPQPVFAAADMAQFNPVLGLTEVGTVMVIAKHLPELFAKSLSSLAAPKSEKLNRKIILLNIVQELFSDDFGISVQQDTTEAHFEFGKSLASDFLSLYICKRKGKKKAEELVSKIPHDIDSFLKGRTLDFFEKINPIFTAAWSFDQKQQVYSKLLAARVEIYNELDWCEYRDTIAYLSTWHPSLKS
ncbi:hypothetical protein [Specibacter sp. NPDC078709]|uniref:hypothetical protein n=1 Tax=Specibacter sp. NPDC078709 TaxID=3154364 RepID=UPI003436714F